MIFLSSFLVIFLQSTEDKDYPESSGRSWDGTDFRSVVFSSFILLLGFKSRKNRIGDIRHSGEFLGEGI